MGEELPLFDGRERLEELEQEKEQLFLELAEVAERQKALARQVFAVERQQRTLLQGVEEHVVEEPLTHEDIEKWVRSVFWRYAKSMPHNPHHYLHVKWCNEGMFRRVARYIRTSGYIQFFGDAGYWTLDLADSFIWTNSGEGGYEDPKPVENLILINRKPMSMKPG